MEDIPDILVVKGQKILRVNFHPFFNPFFNPNRLADFGGKCRPDGTRGKEEVYKLTDKQIGAMITAFQNALTE